MLAIENRLVFLAQMANISNVCRLQLEDQFIFHYQDAYIDIRPERKAIGLQQGIAYYQYNNLALKSRE